MIYAGNEPKSVLARDLGDCRDNYEKLAERVSHSCWVQADKICRLSDCVPALDIEIVKRKEGYDEQTKHIMLY